MRRYQAWLGIGVALLLAVGSAKAQGIDCSKARSPTEKAICASPALMSLDHQVALAYADALARQPAQRDAMRTDLLRWLRQRDSTCNVPASAIERCLSGQLTARLAALAPPAPAQPAASPVPASPITPAASAVQAVLAAPGLPPATDNPPAPAASLDATTLPAAAEADTLLHVTSPGRFAIVARSPSGAGLQLVDMLTGPSEVAGAAGAQDGRLDRLLDVGTYKLRVFSAAGASGSVTLAVTPFHDAAPPAALPYVGQPLSSTLRDGEQRAFWLLVPPGAGNNVRIEAAGRSLADLRLWRDGRELAALDPVQQRVEPVPGHALNDSRLIGRVEPGTYLAIAYGGPSTTWTDNAPDQPFYLRAGVSNALAEGWAGGTIGQFGSEVFTVPPAARLLRLNLPAPAPAELQWGDAVATIEKASRAPTASLPHAPAQQEVAEIRAAAGQAFTLRALDTSTSTTFSRPGTWWVSGVTTGMGGDEVPPAMLLQQSEQRGQPLRVVASTAPRIGPNAAWHGRFNLRGPTDLMFQLPSGGDVGFSSSGVPVRHRRGQLANLPPDYYALTLEPESGALGAVDLVVGPPATTSPPLATPLPADPVIPFGVQTLTPGQFLQLDATTAPGATAGLAARPVPVALAEGPLLATILPGNTLAVPVQIAPGGSLVVTELGAGPLPYGQQDAGTPGRTTVVIPVSDRPRTVVLAWHRTETALAAIPPPPPPGQVASVQAGTPAFLDLRRGEERGFALTVPQGGLFRVETLGRLHTAARLATPFIPNLAQADGNGTGQNMLIQSALRAGRYRVDVRAVESAGHLGLLASTAPLLAGGTLIPGGSVRATLPGGSGVAFPVEITGNADSVFHFDVLSLGADWTGRLEDAEGWPVVTPGTLDGLEPTLRPGHYRLVVTPDSVARQVVARLTATTKAVEIDGHGPHALPFEAPQHATWREPDGKDQPRNPDRWTFSLAGPAPVTLTLGDGMVADLRTTNTANRVARIVGKWTGILQAGDYEVAAASLGRNDRLPYTVTLSSPDLQPGAPRSATLPATMPFSLADARVVSLTSWGRLPVTAVLRREDGTVVARARARPDDWNIAASRLLPAGRYTVELKSAAPPGMTQPSGSGSTDDADTGDSPDDDAPQGDDQKPQTAATQGVKAAKPADSDADQASATSDTPDADNSPKVELTLALPPALPPVPAPTQTTELAGRGVHILILPQPSPGSLVLAQASAAATTVLTLERQDAEGWHIMAIDTGGTPLVAALSDEMSAPWRIEAWTVDGGADPIRLAARALTAPSQSLGQASLSTVDGMPNSMAAAHIRIDAPGLVSIGNMPGLLAGGWPGHALEPAGSNAVVAGTDLWLLSPKPDSVATSALAFPPGGDVTLVLSAGLAAALPASPARDGTVALWRVESGSGQPNLGLTGGIADGSTLALATAPLTLQSDGDTARLRVSRITATLAPARAIDTSAQLSLPAGTALPVTLPPGTKSLQLDLAPGVAAFAGWHDAAPVPVWGGHAAVSRTLAGAWTDLLLVNAGLAAAPARLAVQPGPEPVVLHPGMVLKRFFGAAGSFDLPFEAPSGTRLAAAGDASLIAATADMVARGKTVAVAGNGHAVVQHGPGALAVWLDTPGTPAFPDVAAQPVTVPARMAMSAPSMALSFTPDTPVLLHVSTTGPALVGLQQAGRTDPPDLFAAGAELHRVVAPGPATVRLFSADDGPLSGTVTIWAETLVPLGEGLGDPVTVPPGGSAAFSFTLAKAATIGVGVRAKPDRVEARLLDATGKIVGEGVAQLRPLPAGAYILEARVPPDASPTELRPALIGITPRGNGPPPDVVQSYLELAGMKPLGTP